FSPPGREEYSFGTWTPWWGWGWEGSYFRSDGSSTSQAFTGRTDSAGVHHLKMTFQSVEPPRPTVVRAEASVADVNRQAWNASTSVLVHPSEAYVGLKTPQSFLEKGQPLEVELLVCDVEGKALLGRPVRVKVYRQDYEFRQGQYTTVETDVQVKNETSGNAPTKLSFQTPAGGTYRIEARTSDDKGRPNASDLTVWVAGGKQPPSRTVEQQQVTLIPNQKEYRAGDTAMLLVQAPFYPAEGTLTLRRSGLLHKERFRMEGPSTVLKIPIEEGHVPNLFAQVDLVGAAEREEKGGPLRPAYAAGSLNLSVPPYQRTLKVAVTPAHPSTSPGSQTSLGVQVQGPDGKPVQDAEVALFVVDEAVLALTGYQFPNPLDVFYGQRPAGMSDYHSRQYILLAQLDQLQQMMEQRLEEQSMDKMSAEGAPMPSSAPRPAAPPGRAAKNGPMADEKEAGPPIQVRTDFNPLALFAPVVRTDASGKASVPFKLPDNLTRYRIVALAARGRDFGKGESALVARLPLMVRPSPPRFLNFGDRCELPVVLQNQTGQPMEVHVVARSSNCKLSAQGYALTVPAENRVEVRFPTQTEKAGTASFQVGAAAGEAADAAEFTLPVWTPATTEAFATYGQIDEGGIAQPVKAPADVFEQFGGLQVTTSSTAVQELTDAVLYLVSYPYDCAEQVSSRLMAIAALKDVLSAFQVSSLPSPAELKKGVARDIERLRMLQTYDGGFGFWNTSEQTWPYLTVHVTHSMVRAREKGFEVPQEMLDSSHQYLRDIESHIPGWYGPDARRAITAYAVYVRHRMKDSDYAKARWLIQDAGGVEKLPIEAVGWILYVLSKDPGSAQDVAKIRKFLNNRVTEEAGTAHFVTAYNEDSGWLVLASDRRADGILLEALIEDQPKNDVIPKLVRGLLNHRKAGHWLNTQENCFVLLALDRYFNTYEKATPNFVARAWLGDRFAGEQKFVGRQVDRFNIPIPMKYLAGKGQQTLTLTKEGPGRLYYRLGMDYAPKSLKLEPSDHGFAVERVYEGVDDPKDVSRDEQGVWHVKSGSRVRVRLTMVAPSRRYHVALVDPMPAGLEALNPALAVTGSVPADPSARGDYWYWLGTWYEHQNMRDERVEAYTSLLWSGVYNYTYVARATTPGEFVVPPAKAEEMYNPETFGRSASDRVIVK
ncbi:MAG: alpha-2-macroglobulin family protein, partial [Candidatus Eremiobacterota bacterium]